MAAHAPNPPSVPPSPAARHQTLGVYSRRLSGNPYRLVKALVWAGAGLLLLEGFFYWASGVNYFSRFTFISLTVAVVATFFRHRPVLMSVLLSIAAAGVVVTGGFGLRDTTDPGVTTCVDELTAAIARVPDGYWTRWIVLGGVTGAAMVAGSLLTPRVVGAGLLVVGGSALVIGTFVLWILLNGELKSPPASFDTGWCGQPMALGGTAFVLTPLVAFVLTLPVALLALAAVIPAIWSKPFDRPG